MADNESQHTGGMIALVPADPDALTVAGGDPADQLHLTLAYLGDDVTAWPDGLGAELIRRVRESASHSAAITAQAFGHALFNPDDPERDPCAVYLVGQDGGAIRRAQEDARLTAESVVSVPDHFGTFVPHITAGYNLAVDALIYTGPVLFDRIRVALADDVTDIDLGEAAEPDEDVPAVTVAAVSAKERAEAKLDGLTYPGTDKFPVDSREKFASAVKLAGSSDIPAVKVRKWLMGVARRKGWTDLIPDSWNADGSITAAAPIDDPPAEWFAAPDLDGPTPLTVDENGRLYGHLALWESDHIGLPGQNVRPPRSHADYAYFHTGSRQVVGDDGPRLIATGHITLDTGHAGMDADARSAAAHYDDTGTLVADVCAGEDEYGIWVAGATAPGLDDLRLHKLRACGLSGDWRRIGPGLELVAALSVPTPGFPVPRARIASAGEPMALIAAGALPPGTVDTEAIADAVVARLDQRDADRAERATLLAALGEDARQERAGLVAALGEPDLLERQERDLLLAALEVDDDALTAANWVERTGTGHLPRYIKRISKHLRRKGMTESHAIAVAVNAAKRMCATGDLNFKGLQQVNAGSRTEACAAVAEWEAKKAQAKTQRG